MTEKYYKEINHNMNDLTTYKGAHWNSDTKLMAWITKCMTNAKII